ncbi:MAG: hypothetical protein H0W61_06660 [Bacteroidetes bacterium]|nr:hypothetical protein [Bacteroidota bacterium]
MHYSSKSLEESRKCPGSPMFYKSMFTICSVYDQRDGKGTTISIDVPLNSKT